MEPHRTGTTVIIPAAGSGIRLGAEIPKAFVHVDGVPMLALSARAFSGCDAVILAAPARHVRDASEILTAAGVDHAVVVAGGSSRAESIEKALAAVPAGTQYVLVHDAARPAVPAAVIDRVIRALHDGAEAVVPVVPVTDSLKQVSGDVVVAHADRSRFARAQTPQGFRLDTLRRAYASARASGRLADATDDVSLAADIGVPVTTVAGDEANVKVTTAADLTSLQRHASAADVRSGIGTDVHAFAADGQLALAGLTWPGVPALAGHSDGDAALHALCDAFLAAAGLGDLGQQFGVDDPEWAGASGLRLLEVTVQMLATAGWQPVSAQVQVIGNRPRFAPRRAEAQQLVSAVVGVDVFFSATTTDGLGFPGRGEGIAATATVLIRRRGAGQVLA